MSVSTSLVGSSRISTFGSDSRISSSCSRRFWPPDRSADPGRQLLAGEAEPLQQLRRGELLAVDLT